MSKQDFLTGLSTGVAATLVVGFFFVGSDDNSTALSTNGAPAQARAAGGIACASGSLTGAGSSFQKNIVAEWTKGYLGACPDADIDYQPVGSGAGIAQFTEGTVTFAGSDSEMKDDERAKARQRCGGAPALHLPMTSGGIALAYRLAGVEELRLSAPVLAGLFEGRIRTWDAEEVAADNPGVELPDTPVQAVHRSDGSGSTDIVSEYLEANAGPAWTLGTGKELDWPSGTTGAKGSDGVTAAVQGTEGAITYVEVSFAQNAGLPTASVSNGAGDFAALTPETVRTAVEGFELPASGGDLTLDIDYADATPGAYPVVGVTYEIVCSAGTPATSLELLKSFLTYTATDGQAAAEGAGFAPLPETVATRVTTVVAGLR